MTDQPTISELRNQAEDRVSYLQAKRQKLEQELKEIDEELTMAGVLFAPQKKTERRQYRTVLRKLLEPCGMLVDELISLAASHEYLSCDQKYVREAFERWVAVDNSVIVSEDEDHMYFVHIKKE